MSYLAYFRGPPGVGKSTIARGLGAKLKIPVIDYDDVKGELVSYLQMPELAIASYNIVNNLLRTNSSLGFPVIFDSHGYYKEAFDKCVSLVGLGQILLVNCQCSSEEEWRLRLAARARTTKKSQINDLERIIATTNMEPVEARYPIDIDTVNPVDHNVSLIIGYLRQINFS